MSNNEKHLAPWRKDFIEKLDEDTKRLIALANHDLYSGPLTADTAESEEEFEFYVGFTSACRRIREALEDVPSTLYVSIQFDGWTEYERETEEDPEDWIKLDRRDLLKSIVGSELAQYVS